MKTGQIDLFSKARYTRRGNTLLLKQNPMDLKGAAEKQHQLASQLILEWRGDEVNTVAGADFSYDPQAKRIGACIIVIKIPELDVIEVSHAVREVEFPYIPGYLAFREGPAFLEAFPKIKNKPDLTFIDGNGIAHPRKMGLASFVGVELDICTVGCAKSPFFQYTLPPEQRGSYTFIMNNENEKVGICLRTRTQVKPIFVSPGYKIDIESAMRLALLCSKFRIPEPLRRAHILAKKIFQ